MKCRSETAKMPGMLSDFSAQHCRRTVQYVEQPSAEIIRQIGQIHGRSRHFMNHQG